MSPESCGAGRNECCSGGNGLGRSPRTLELSWFVEHGASVASRSSPAELFIDPVLARCSTNQPVKRATQPFSVGWLVAAE